MEILFETQNYELSYFILYMESVNLSNNVKFLLDLNNFEQTFDSNYNEKVNKRCKACELNLQNKDTVILDCNCKEEFYKSKHKNNFVSK